MPSLFSTIKFRIVLFGLIFPIQSYSQHTSISGRLTDLETGEPLPSATVSAFHKGRLTATVANKDGGFKLQLDAVPDSMKFSMIGYRSKTITGGQGADADSFTISLHRLQVIMEEVVVKPLSAIDIIRQAIIQITRLQPINSFETTGFYREIIRDRDHYFSVSEAIFTTQFDPPKKKYAL